MNNILLEDSLLEKIERMILDLKHDLKLLKSQDKNNNTDKIISEGESYLSHLGLVKRESLKYFKKINQNKITTTNNNLL